MMTDTVRSRPVLVTLMALSLVLSPLLGTGALSAAAEESPEDESPAAHDADAASSPDEGGADASDQPDQTDQDNAGAGSGDASGQGAGGDEAADGEAGDDQSDASSGQGAGVEDDAGSGSGVESEPAAEPESSENAEGREGDSSQQQDEAADESSEGSEASSGQAAGEGGSGGAEAGEASESGAGEDAAGEGESDGAASGQGAGGDEAADGEAGDDQSDASSGQGAGVEDDAGSGSGAESEPADENSEEADENSDDAHEGTEEAEEDPESAEESQQGEDDPPHGNVGSVKVAPVGGAATPPGMEPHIEGCAFDILIHGRGDPDSVSVDIFAQPPTGDAHLRTVTVDLDGDAPAPGNEPSGRTTVDLESQLREMAEAGELDEHDQQGFHLKLYVDTPEGGAKQKVFWLDCAVPDEEGEAAPGEPDEEDEQEQDEQEQDEDVAPDDQQLEGELMVAKEVAGDAPADSFEFVIECDDDEWTRTVAAGEAGEPVTVDLGAEEESASCTVTEVETHGADEVTVDGEGITDDPQVAVEVDAGESVETVFVNAFDDEDVAPGEEPPAGGERPDGEAPAEDAPAEDAPAEDAPAEDAPAEDAPAEDAPAEGGSAGPPAEEEPSEVAPSDEVPEDEVLEDEAPEDPPEEVASESAPSDRPLFEAVAPEGTQREHAPPEQTEREHVAAGSTEVQQVTAADETRELAATGLSVPAQLMVALVAIGAGATLLTVTSVRGRAWGARTRGSLR